MRLRSIAQAAADLVRAGDFVYIDAGSTTLELVRALAAQRLLCRRGLSSTLYLGCGMEEGKMVAHAWLRFGEMYVTGGDGGGYTTVARFCKEASGKRG